MAGRQVVNSLLSFPRIYLALQNAVGADKARAACLRDYCRVQPGHRVLDVGCGPGYVLDLLPDVTYVGFDVDRAYISYAKQRYGSRGDFRCELLTTPILESLGAFDRIILMGVLHHLSDSDACGYLRMLAGALKPDGLLVTLDGVYLPGQSWFAKVMLDHDRGRFVRDTRGYMDLARAFFPSVEYDVRHDIFRIPYTTLIMSCQGREG